MDPISDEVKGDKNQSRKMLVRKALRILGALGRFLFLAFVSAAALSAGFCLQAYLYCSKDMPSIEKLKNHWPPIVSCVYDEQGKVIAEFSHQRRFVVPIEEIPHPLQAAFVAAEDKNSFVHSCPPDNSTVYLLRRIVLGSSRKCGCKTIGIEQQIARALLLKVCKCCVRFRKIKEAILSVRIEKSFDKKEILYLYLNEIYLGSGAYGVEAAARTYFGKHVGELSLAECAMIAGLAKAPGKNSPSTNLQRALERRAYVLKRMLEDGYINQDQYERALNDEPKLAPKESPFPAEAERFVSHVERYVTKKYDSDMLYREGLQIYTTWHPDMSAVAKAANDEDIGNVARSLGVSPAEQQGAVSMVADTGPAVRKAYITTIIDRKGRVLEQGMAPGFSDDHVHKEKR